MKFVNHAGRPITVELKPICKYVNAFDFADSNLWVAFDANKTKKAWVFQSDATRDHVRTAFTRLAGLDSISDARATRLGTYTTKYDA